MIVWKLLCYISECALTYSNSGGNMNWQDTYNKERIQRFTDSPFSRLRCKTKRPIYMRLNKHHHPLVPELSFGAPSNIFSRCKFCDGLKIRGICQDCGSVEPCSYCKEVIQPDNSTRKIGYSYSRNISHGICKKCFKKEKRSWVV